MGLYRLLADVVVFLHAAYIGFVILGLLAIFLGVVFRWSWARNFWFRAVHLTAILVVVGEALLGVVCPLTTLEDYLRVQGGSSPESGSFVGRWLHELIFVEASPEQLTLAYSLFGILVLLTFFLCPPRWPGRSADMTRGGVQNDC